MRTFHKITTYIGFLRVFNKTRKESKTLYFSIPNGNTYYVCDVKQNGMIDYAYIGTKDILSLNFSAILKEVVSIWSKSDMSIK